MDARVCPLCEKSKHMHKARPLYGRLVCKKCYYSFANRRQLAFFVDSILLRVLGFAVGFGVGFLIVTGMGRLDHDLLTVVGWGIDIPLIGLFFCKDCFAGQSPGKM